ncbi:DUF2470 domain-containing protein [Microbacterium indicum]|uniref:DUF2470 domain-containing protein n=1 Tax=Microbacterium indicum TaxID=358100 RepID=UPI0003FDD307|nr:DUF2470 domain-containing protein [Microbacterium indicum]
MANQYPSEIVDAILGHMNADHRDDNSVIARAHVAADAASARMTGFDGDAGEWSVELASGETVPARIPWPGGPIEDRASVRREIVTLYDDALAQLGLPPRSQTH